MSRTLGYTESQLTRTYVERRKQPVRILVANNHRAFERFVDNEKLKAKFDMESGLSFVSSSVFDYLFKIETRLQELESELKIHRSRIKL